MWIPTFESNPVLNSLVEVAFCIKFGVSAAILMY